MGFHYIMKTLADSEHFIGVRGVGPGNFCFSIQRISQRVVQTSLENQLDPRCPIASRGGFVPVVLKKHLSTCDFFS